RQTAPALRYAGTESAGRRRGPHRWSTFFFSSRRRHTRWPRDWSSDVCSSDLLMHEENDQSDCEPAHAPLSISRPPPLRGQRRRRSEERRVGKECRGRWSWELEKIKDETTWDCR